MVFTMPTDRYPWAGDAVERFEYEVRSQMHYVQEKFPLSLFIGHTQRRQAFFFVLQLSGFQVILCFYSLLLQRFYFFYFFGPYFLLYYMNLKE